MPKNDKNNSLIDDPQRCEICETQLTLYPKDFAACPHCQRRVCRQCWGAVWASKSFAAEACGHMAENDGMATSPVGQRRGPFNWDWQKAIFVSLLGALAVGTAWFLVYLFIS